jgi:transposase
MRRKPSAKVASSGVTHTIRPLWKVEDCFAQLGRWRRRSLSYDATTESATTWLHVACVGYLLTKL